MGTKSNKADTIDELRRAFDLAEKIYPGVSEFFVKEVLTSLTNRSIDVTSSSLSGKSASSSSSSSPASRNQSNIKKIVSSPSHSTSSSSSSSVASSPSSHYPPRPVVPNPVYNKTPLRGNDNYM